MRLRRASGAQNSHGSSGVWGVADGFVSAPAGFRPFRAWGFRVCGLLGGSWVVLSGFISKVTIFIRGLIAILITTP